MPEISVNPDEIDAVLSGLSDPQQTWFWRLYRGSNVRLTNDERALRSELRQLFKDASDDVVADIGRVFNQLGADNWDLTTMRRLGRDTSLLKQINSRISALGGRVDKKLADGLADAFNKAGLEEAYRMASLTPGGVQIQFGLMPDREILGMLYEPFNGANFSQRLGLITNDMAHEIQQDLIRSMIDGESWQGAARRIRDNMGATTQRGAWARADTIARTEIARAQTLASRQFAAENVDISDGDYWLAHPGACWKVCQPKNGEPCDRVGFPPDDSHPNCTCDHIIRPKPWDKLAGDGEEMPTPQPFADWADENGFGGLA